MNLNTLANSSITVGKSQNIKFKSDIKPDLNQPKEKATNVSIKDAIKVSDTQSGNANLNVGFIDNNHTNMIMVKINLLAQQRKFNEMDSEANKLIKENPQDKVLISNIKFLQGKIYLEKGLPEKAFQNFNEILKINPNSEQSEIIKNSFSKIIKDGKIVNDNSLKNRILSATQVTVNASASNNIQTTMAYSIGGTIIGAGLGKLVGVSPTASALLGETIGSMANRVSGIIKNKEQIVQSFNTGYSNISTSQNVINTIGLAIDVAAFGFAANNFKNTISSKNLTLGKTSLANNTDPQINKPVNKSISSSTSGEPVSSGFRQYSDEAKVGKAGKGWVHSYTQGIPSPENLSKVKGSAKITGADAFNNTTQNMKLQGSSIDEIVSKVPKEAKLRELQPMGNSQVKEGFEYGWIDKKTNMDYRVRVHGADAGVALHNPNSTAAQGWIVRVERNPVGQATFPKTEYLTLDGTYHKATELMSLEKKKKDVELAISVIKDYQTETLGKISYAGASGTSGKAISLPLVREQEAIQLQNKLKLNDMIEHFHHNTHIGVGGLNKALNH
jgi:hypothetical protein